MQYAVEAQDALSTLTEKQCEVLDLVLQHKSSKEIARALKISPYTVDQRIAAARGKLGVNSRGELACAYAKLKEGICGKPAYGSSQVEIPPSLEHVFNRVRNEDPVFTLSDVTAINLAAPWEGMPSANPSLEALDNRFGVFGRIGAIFALAAFIALMFLAMVAIAETLTKLI